MQTKKSNKELINCFKDYIDIADASYAMLHNVFENERNGLDELYDKFGKDNVPENIVNSYREDEKKKPIWRYADDITLGDKIDKSNETDTSQANNRNFGDSTAYALCIEARFMADKIIKKPYTGKKFIKLDNDVTNFIDTPLGKDGSYQEAEIFYAPESFSPRTKLFVNRYELVKHIPNQKSGFSSTIFYDTLKSNYIIGFRGTEMKMNDLLDDAFMAITSRALMQISALKSLQSSMQEAINSHSQNLSGLDNTTKDIILSGHSLGGHLAQIYAVTFKDSGVRELYTYNAPGIYGGILASAFTWSLRLLSFVAKAIAKGARWIARVIDKDGFIGKMVGSVFNKIKGMFGFKDDKSSVDEYVDVVKNNEQAQKTLADKKVSSNINKASKEKDIDIEIHHVESVKQSINRDKDSFSKDVAVLIEPTFSVISDLGYKLGIDTTGEVKYENTENRHLVNILIRSHFLKESVLVLYMLCYLLENKENEAKIEGKDIAEALDYLNEYIQSLKFKLKCIRSKLNLDVDIDDISDASMLDTPLYIFYAYLNLFYEYGKFSDENFKQDMVGYIIENLGSNIDKNNNKEAHLVKILDIDDLDKLDATKIVSDARAGDIDMLVAICALNLFVFEKNIDVNELGKYFSYNKNIYKNITILRDNRVDIAEASIFVKDRIDMLKSIINLKYADLAKLKENENFLASIDSKDISSSDEAIVIANNKSAQNNDDVAYNNKVATDDIKALMNESVGSIFYKNNDTISVSAVDKSIVDVEVLKEIFKLDSKNMNQRIYLNSALLSKANEEEDYPLYFKDEKYNSDENIPLNFTHQPRDEDKDIGRLNVAYKNSQANILNYSLLNKSLNINLKPMSKKTKEALSNLNQRQNLQKDNQSKEISSTATSCPVIEDDTIICPHGGHVILKSRAGRSIRSDDQGVILDVDFINSPIVGCSARTPCVIVAYVPRSALSLKSMNDHYAVMQDLVPNCLSNTGSSLRCIKKENKLKLEHSLSNPMFENNNLAVQNPNLNKPLIRLHIKAFASQIDNLLVTTYYLFDKKFEDKNGFSKIKLNLDEGRDVEDKNLKALLADNYDDKRYDIKEFKLRYGVDKLNLIFVVPKNFSSLDKENYKKANSPESGVGFFASLDEFNSSNIEKNRRTYTYVFMSPTGAKSIELEIAKGLDSGYTNDINTTSFVMLVS
ncbi:Mbeg1-like protein [Campylobacter concisus]